jgi:DNA-binding CsgD family transcriptional regulator
MDTAPATDPTTEATSGPALPGMRWAEPARSSTRAERPAGQEAELREALTAALDAMLLEVENGPLQVTTVVDGSLVVLFEHGCVRCTVVADLGQPGQLSPRELQIAHLVADGATNRAIGRTLDISLWTVSTHLRRIFAKLGVTNRAEMVARLYGAPGPVRLAGADPGQQSLA